MPETFVEGEGGGVEGLPLYIIKKIKRIKFSGIKSFFLPGLLTRPEDQLRSMKYVPPQFSAEADGLSLVIAFMSD